VSEPTLSKAECEALAARCYRSRVEFARVFLPEWFPSKMPWFHRGLIALRTGRTEFLLDFGPEWWPADVKRGVASEWTTADLVKIVTNFVVTVKEAKYDSAGRVLEPEETRPLFALDYDSAGAILSCRIISPSRYNATMIPRGMSKTTLLNMMNLADVVFRDEPFVLYVSETATHSVKQLITIRRALEQNLLLRTVFGNLVPERSSSLKWTDELIELTNGTRLAAVGRGGQIRGISLEAQRPTRISIDDLQDEEGVQNDAQRKKDLDWLFRTLLPAGQNFGEHLTNYDMYGTLLHPEAVLPQVIDDPDWQGVTFGLIDRQGEPLWAYAYTLEAIAALREKYARMGRLDAFDYEYMSQRPRSGFTMFPLDKVLYILRPEEWFEAIALAMDPAISADPKADFCAFAVSGMGKTGHIHLLDFYAEVGMDPADQVNKFFELHFAHLAGRMLSRPDTVKHGVEAIAYQRSLINIIKSQQFERSKTWGPRAYFPIEPIQHGKTSKVARVQGIIGPRMRAGQVSFQHRFPVLETQIRDWGAPNTKKDGPDVFAMSVMLLDPYAALAANDNPDNVEGVPGMGELAKLSDRFRAGIRKAP
jgi:hypothetical protein